MTDRTRDYSNHSLRWLGMIYINCGLIAAVSICVKPSWLMKKPQHPQQCCTVHKGASPLPFVEIPEVSISPILYSSSSSLIQCSFHTALGQKYFCHLKTKWILYLDGTWMQTFSGGSTSGMKKARRRRVSCTASMLRHRNKYFLKFLLSYLR